MHERGKMGAAPTSNSATCEQCHYLCVGIMSEFFFFFFNMDLRRLNSNSHRFKPIPTKPSRFNQNRVLMGRIRSIGQRLKQAEIGLESCRNNWNRLWMRPKHPKSIIPQFYFQYLLLLLCFLFCFVFLAFFLLCFVNQWHIMCFLRIF